MGVSSEYRDPLHKVKRSPCIQPVLRPKVAPVEGRIATALAENMEAIRDFVEERLDGMESVTAASFRLISDPKP